MNTEERFWSKVQVGDPDDCWEWKASNRQGGGYGQFKLDGTMKLAHRVAWELTSGVIPEDLCVCHHCDNCGCMNPAHLFLGTKADNSADMVAKGRQRSARGTRNGNSKLTQLMVLEIRRLLASGLTQTAIGKIFEVNSRTINKIATGRRWNWL